MAEHSERITPIEVLVDGRILRDPARRNMPLSGPVVLTVFRNGEARWALRDALENLGYGVVEARNVAEAKCLLGSFPDMIVADESCAEDLTLDPRIQRLICVPASPPMSARDLDVRIRSLIATCIWSTPRANRRQPEPSSPEGP